MFSNISFSSFIKYLVLALLVYMPVFGFLDTQPLRMWDESRNAINAYEMYKGGDYLVTHFKGEPEMWNTKPPLLIWLQVFFMKLIGVNEIAVRLPSSFAAFFTCLALLLFLTRYLKSFWPGFITVLILVTTQGYINIHIVRTGDYDALLTLFTTASCLFLFTFCETQKTKYLYLFFLSLILGALTKGIAGLMFTPAYLIYLLSQKKLLVVLKNKHFYFGVLCFLMVISTYYFSRELRNPGYFQAVKDNEWGGRYLISQGGQKFDFWFYLKNFMSDRLADRYFLVPFGIVIGLFSNNIRLRKFTYFITVMGLTYFIVISSAKTQLHQYDAPLYPFLCFSIAIVIYSVFEWIKNAITNTTLRKIIPFVFLIALFAFPYKKIWDKTYRAEEPVYWDAAIYQIGYFLKDAINGKYDLNNKYLVYDGYDAHVLFYLHLLKDRGVKTGFKYFLYLKKGDVVYAYQKEMKDYIRDNFLYQETQVTGDMYFFTITGY